MGNSEKIGTQSGKRNYKLSSPNTTTNLSVKSSICNIAVKVKILLVF